MKLIYCQQESHIKSNVSCTNQRHNTLTSLRSFHSSDKYKSLINIKTGSKLQSPRDWKKTRKRLKRKRMFRISNPKLTGESWLSISLVSAETTIKVTSIFICVGCCAGADPWGTRTRRKKNSLLSKQQLLSWRCTTCTIRLHCRRFLR